MHHYLRQFSLCFSAGVLGAVVNTIAFWVFGLAGAYSLLGVDIPYGPTLSGVYSRLVWGGLWGFLFLVPFPRESYILRGAIYSIAPTLFQLFIVFPLMRNAGVMGLELGGAAPLIVIVLNAIWGMSAGLWLWLTDGASIWSEKYYSERPRRAA